jgi:hypothetical protein
VEPCDTSTELEEAVRVKLGGGDVVPPLPPPPQLTNGMVKQQIPAASAARRLLWFAVKPRILGAGRSTIIFFVAKHLH